MDRSDGKTQPHEWDWVLPEAQGSRPVDVSNPSVTRSAKREGSRAGELGLEPSLFHVKHHAPKNKQSPRRGRPAPEARVVDPTGLTVSRHRRQRQ